MCHDASFASLSEVCDEWPQGNGNEYEVTDGDLWVRATSYNREAWHNQGVTIVHTVASSCHTQTVADEDVRYWVVEISGASGKFYIESATKCLYGDRILEGSFPGGGEDGAACRIDYYSCPCPSTAECETDSDCTDASKSHCTTGGNCVACTTDSHCGTSDTTWVSNGTGKEKKTTYSCTNNACSSKKEYRCSNDYYGDGYACTKCPGPGTASAGSTSKSDCCIPVGATGSSSIGNYKYTSECCWQ